MNITQVIKEYITYTKPVKVIVFKREKPLIVTTLKSEMKSVYILYLKISNSNYRVIFLDDLSNESFVKSFIFNNPEERADYYFRGGILNDYYDFKKDEFYD